MEMRVVCGLSVTMATFWPTSAFSSVDLPALGRPMMDTKPERKVGSLMSHGLRLADLDLLDAQVVAGHGFEANAIALDRLSSLGHAAEPFGEKAADCGRFDIFFAAEGFHEVGHAVEIEVAGNDKAAFAILCDIAGGFVFIANLTDDHFEQVFHGG